MEVLSWEEKPRRGRLVGGACQMCHVLRLQGAPWEAEGSEARGEHELFPGLSILALLICPRWGSPREPLTHPHMCTPQVCPSGSPLTEKVSTTNKCFSPLCSVGPPGPGTVVHGAGNSIKHPLSGSPPFLFHPYSSSLLLPGITFPNKTLANQAKPRTGFLFGRIQDKP